VDATKGTLQSTEKNEKKKTLESDHSPFFALYQPPAEPYTSLDQPSEQKTQYRQKHTSSGQTTPTERRRIIEPGMKEIYGVCLNMARGAEEKKLKKRNKKQPHMFVNSIYNVDDDSSEDDDDDSNSSNSSDDDDSTSEPSTEENAQTDLEIDALQDQLHQMMSATQVSQAANIAQKVEQQKKHSEPARRVKVRKPQALFELKMDHATLLEKRRRNVPLAD
jgi:hypothetical protein